MLVSGHFWIFFDDDLEKLINMSIVPQLLDVF